jgi:hypothetical protein
MILKELKEFVAKLPDTMDEFHVVNGEVGVLKEEGSDENLTYRIDKPIIALYVDEKSKEVCLFHQTQEDVNKVLKDGNTTGS